MLDHGNDAKVDATIVDVDVVVFAAAVNAVALDAGK